MGLVTVLGTCLGAMIAQLSDVELTLTTALLFPGFLVRPTARHLFGTTAGTLACCLGNGAAYGCLLYGWFRLAAALRRRIPEWFGALGRSLAQRGIRW